MPVLAEESLAKDKEIAFNAGTHSELIRLSWEDFVRLVKPKVLDFDVVTPHGSHASYKRIPVPVVRNRNYGDPCIV